MKRVFKYIMDPGHGWVKVTFKALHDVGLTEGDFTPYSPHGKRTIYLEEDVDAPKFLAAYKAKYGHAAKLEEIYVEKRPWFAR